MKLHSLLLPFALACRVSAWDLSLFKNFIVFGDSYSDDHTYPVAGLKFLPNLPLGRVWPQYVAQYTNYTTAVTDYAFSGATCSNLLAPRIFPSVAEFQIPNFLASSVVGSIGLGNLPQWEGDSTAFAMYIGGNDLGVFIMNDGTPDSVLERYIDCVFDQLYRVYQRGGRYFVVFNATPLYLTPLYANSSQHGVYSSPNWINKPDRDVVYAKMKRYVDIVNDLYNRRVLKESATGSRFGGARFSLFDVKSLFTDIYVAPNSYLNGTQKPYNVTDFEKNHDVVTSPDSFMWYDDLHPSEQVDRYIASTFLQVVNGTGKYVKTF